MFHVPTRIRRTSLGRAGVGVDGGLAVLDGLDAARDAGLAVKINMVALKGINEDEIVPMLHWCDDQGFDLTLIETMPLGETGEDRTDQIAQLLAAGGVGHAEEAHRQGDERTLRDGVGLAKLGLIEIDEKAELPVNSSIVITGEKDAQELNNEIN